MKNASVMDKPVISTAEINTVWVLTEDAWLDDSLEKVKDLAAERGFKRDTVKVRFASTGKYGYGVLYRIIGELKNPA